MKIYTWQYQGKTGIVYADNMKSAKQELAVKQGNPKKIKKGTKIEKTGLCKNKPAKVIVIDTEKINTKPTVELDLGEKQNKATIVTGPGSYMINGAMMYIGSDVTYKVSRGDMVKKVY